MFTCYNGDGNLDDVDAEPSFDDSDELFTEIDVKQPADDLFGSHDCMFDKMPKGFRDANVKVVITQKANANYQNTVNGEFKAQLFAYNQGNGILKENIVISCMKRGEQIQLVNCINYRFKCIQLRS